MVDMIETCSAESFFFFKQKTAYEMRISDWSSDVCSSDLAAIVAGKEIDPHIAARIALAAGNAQYPAVVQHVAARIEPAMPAEARRIRIFSVGGAVRILFRRDIGEKAEFSSALRQGVDKRVAIVDALAHPVEANEHRAHG